MKGRILPSTRTYVVLGVHCASGGRGREVGVVEYVQGGDLGGAECMCDFGGRGA
jgi:hypothetical protein